MPIQRGPDIADLAVAGTLMGASFALELARMSVLKRRANGAQTAMGSAQVAKFCATIR
jgi:hypothetical protein